MSDNKKICKLDLTINKLEDSIISLILNRHVNMNINFESLDVENKNNVTKIRTIKTIFDKYNKKNLTFLTSFYQLKKYRFSVVDEIKEDVRLEAEKLNMPLPVVDYKPLSEYKIRQLIDRKLIDAEIHYDKDGNVIPGNVKICKEHIKLWTSFSTAPEVIASQKLAKVVDNGKGLQLSFVPTINGFTEIDLKTSSIKTIFKTLLAGYDDEFKKEFVDFIVFDK